MKVDDALYKTLLENLNDGVYICERDRSIAYWNKGAERITGYSSEEVLGRPCSDNMLAHIDKEGNKMCLGMCPLNDAMADGQERSADVYLQHKDGHRVHVSVRVAAVRDEKGAVTGAIEVFTDHTSVAVDRERLAELEQLAFLDPLTGLANRRYAEITLRARIEELQRYGWRFGLLFIDIDHFKGVNDRYGHDIGDEVLKMVAKTLQNSVRPFDVVSRWGGEEYVVVIAHVEGDELLTTANRCRTLVESSHIPAPSSARVTISIGATLAREDDSVESLVKRADEFMYRCKATGRNCVMADSQEQKEK